MPRPRVGQVWVERHVDHWDVRIELPSGERSRRACMPAQLTKDEAKAEARRLKGIAWRVGATLARDDEPAPAEEGETVEEWADRWFTAREAKGQEQSAERARWGKWIHAAPVRGRAFGALAIASVTREDLEDLVVFLDAQVTAEKLSWKTAANAWALASKAFSDAKNAKDRSIRARADNPAAEVRGPDRGPNKAKAWLYPKELLAVLSLADEPLEVRRAVALNAYLYARPGELRALTWSDVDLEAGSVEFHGSIRRDGEEKGTKTGNVRTVPIEPALLPLLGAMRQAANGEGRVIELPPDTALADVLRRLLHKAKVTRAKLYVSSKTRKQITWYDLRATGVTWRAIRGDNPIAIMQHAGHADFKTTQVYIREAQSIGADFGPVFPALPPELYESAIGVPSGRPEFPTQVSHPKAAKYREAWWVDRDSNPGPTD